MAPEAKRTKTGRHDTAERPRRAGELFGEVASFAWYARVSPVTPARWQRRDPCVLQRMVTGRVLPSPGDRL